MVSGAKQSPHCPREHIGGICLITAIYAALLPTSARAGNVGYVMYPLAYSGSPPPCVTLPHDLNDDGTVVGEFYFDGIDPIHAFIWQNGVMADVFASYPGVAWYAATGISAGGSIAGVGYFLTDDQWIFHGFVHDRGEFAILPIPSGCQTSDQPNGDIAAISPNGRYLVGECLSVDGNSNCIPAFYDAVAGTAINLALPDGFPEGTDFESFDVNNSGVVVGRIFLEGAEPNPAFIWADGTMEIIASTVGGEAANAYAINSQGTIVGSAEIAPDSFDAMMLKDDTMTIIGPGTAVDVNEREQAVGSYLENLSVRHAVLYDKGQVFELNPFLPDEWRSKRPFAINNYGWIVGWADDEDNHQIGWLLLPIYAKGDFDGDEDVDFQDFGHFQRCFAAEPYIDATLHVGCSVFDFNDDVDLDLTDYEAFQTAFTGPITSG